MAALTNYGEALVIDWLLRKDAVASPARPSAVYMSLHTADPTESAISTAEVSGNNYARKQVLFSAPGGTGNTANSGSVTFNTATGSWGTITHLGLWDSLTNGNMIMYGIATSSLTITNGQTYSISSGSFTLVFD